MVNEDLVSIITPMYKGASLVGATIESVLNQTYTNWEMIIVDDCSPDNGAGIQVVKKYDDPRIRLIESKVNKGSSGARNIGLRESKGRYIAFLDSDDLWPNNYLESQVEYIKKNNAFIVYGAVQHIDELTKVKLGSPFPRPKRINYDGLLKICPICPSATIYDIEKCNKHYFNETLGSLRDDWVYWLDMLKKEVPFAEYNSDIVILYRVRKGAVTGKKTKLINAQWTVLRKIEHISFIKSIYCVCCWGIVGFFKFKIYK